MNGTERSLIALLAVLALALPGCGGSSHDHGDAAHEAVTAAADAAHDIVDQAVAVARDLESDAKPAEQVLEDHGMTAEKFEDLLYEISGDSKLAKKFREALGI
jgi:hypothetical protein